MDKDFAEQQYSLRHRSFEDWYQTPLGRSLLADQRRVIDRLTENLTGARQLHVALSHRLPVASGTDFSQRILTTPNWSDRMPDGVAVCDPDELPFSSESMDLVILHHTADFSYRPHQVIREAARVLRGEGTLLLIGFNPISTWGLRRLVSRQRLGPWGGRFLLRSRMEDWLSLLDFRIETSETSFHGLPLRTAAVQNTPNQKRKGRGLNPLGAYYSILARKQICARLPRKPVWRAQNVIALPGRGSVGISRGMGRIDRDTKE